MLRVVRRNSQCFLRLVEYGMTRLGDSSRQLATGSQLRREVAIRDGSKCPPKQSTSQTVPLQECLSAHYIRTSLRCSKQRHQPRYTGATLALVSGVLPAGNCIAAVNLWIAPFHSDVK
jgi:hypothetical protein